MKYREFFLIESWKDYVVSTNPEVLLYDFYVLSYLTTLPLEFGKRGFSGTFIGRDPTEISLDIKEVENKLLPVLQKKLSDALFLAICAEVRHVLDISQDYKNYKKNTLLKQYLRNYTALSNLPSEFQPRRGLESPSVKPKDDDYKKSYQAAIKAIKETGSTKEQFANLCASMFKNLKWKSSYGGPVWAKIAEAYILLNKSPQTNAELQIAIDHAYDLQHNTGTVLNKVKDYYIKDDITWLSNALDFKANLKNIYELLPKCSSDLRKLALEAFKTAGINKNSLVTPTKPEKIVNKNKKSTIRPSKETRTVFAHTDTILLKDFTSFATLIKHIEDYVHDVWSKNVAINYDVWKSKFFPNEEEEFEWNPTTLKDDDIFDYLISYFTPEISRIIASDILANIAHDFSEIEDVESQDTLIQSLHDHFLILDLKNNKNEYLRQLAAKIKSYGVPHEVTTLLKSNEMYTVLRTVYDLLEKKYGATFDKIFKKVSPPINFVFQTPPSNLLNFK